MDEQHYLASVRLLIEQIPDEVHPELFERVDISWHTVKGLRDAHSFNTFMVKTEKHPRALQRLKTAMLCGIARYYAMADIAAYKAEGTPCPTLDRADGRKVLYWRQYPELKVSEQFDDGKIYVALYCRLVIVTWPEKS